MKNPLLLGLIVFVRSANNSAILLHTNNLNLLSQRCKDLGILNKINIPEKKTTALQEIKNVKVSSWYTSIFSHLNLKSTEKYLIYCVRKKAWSKMFDHFDFWGTSWCKEVAPDFGDTLRQGISHITLDETVPNEKVSWLAVHLVWIW